MNLNPFYKNPADSAMPYLDKIPGTITPYFQPYISAGKDSMSTLMDQYNQLLSNPSDMLNKVGEGYQKSPGYDYQLREGLDAANKAAAAGGMLGTAAHQQDATQVAQDISNKDFEQWLQHALSLYGRGLSGEEGINQMGFNASTGLADDLAANLGNQAGTAYQSTANQNAANGDFMKFLSQGLGYAMGGPMGGMAGGAIGGLFGGGAPKPWLNPDTLQFE